jgi:hypothetical protein
MSFTLKSEFLPIFQKTHVLPKNQAIVDLGSQMPRLSRLNDYGVKVIPDMPNSRSGRGE